MLDSTPSMAVKMPMSAVMPKVMIPEVIQDRKELLDNDFVAKRKISRTFDIRSKVAKHSEL